MSVAIVSLHPLSAVLASHVLRCTARQLCHHIGKPEKHKNHVTKCD